MNARNITALLLTVALYFSGCQSPSRGRADDNISAMQALEHNTELRKAHQHTVITEDWGSLSWLAGKNIGNAEGLVLGRATIKPGKTNPRHRHPKSEEVLYLLKGSIKHTLGDRTIIMQAGDTITIAPGVFHNASCIGEEDADMIVVYSEGIRGFELE
jgi:quercetin dioxygenase-like cupin family protein